MNLEDAQEHAEHLCDVWPTAEDNDHVGVIEEIQIRGQFPVALVSGHPDHPGRWFLVDDLGTSCKLVTHYHRSGR